MPFTVPGVRAWVTTAHEPGNLNLATVMPGEKDDSAAQRRRMIDELTGGIQWVSQTHSARVVPAADLAGQPPVEADAILVTPGFGGGVMVADCVPVMLAATTPDGPIGAVIHAGRAGVLTGIVPAALRELTSRGATQIEAVIGPHICAKCYEVPPDMADDADSQVPGTKSQTRWGTPAIDLAEGVRRQLGVAGVVEINVPGVTGVCTREDVQFFSHRRATADGSVAGRFAAILRVEVCDTPPSLPAQMGG